MEDLTVKQAVESLQYTERWVRQLLADGKLKGRHNGREWLIPEAEIERYRSGKTDRQEIVLSTEEEAAIPTRMETLRADLMSEQARDSMARHSKYLQSEAGRWLEVVQAFHDNDKRFDYRLSSPGFPRSRIAEWLLTHLKNDQPTTCEKLRLWLTEARAFREKVMSLQEAWRATLASRLEEEKILFGGARHDQVDDFFGVSIWGIILAYPPGDAFYYHDTLGPPYELQEYMAGRYRLCYDSQSIAAGTEQWLNRAQDLHQIIYDEHAFHLPLKVRQMGLYDQQLRVKTLGAEASHCLEIVALGGVIFRPGTCEMCAGLLV